MIDEIIYISYNEQIINDLNCTPERPINTSFTFHIMNRL